MQRLTLPLVALFFALPAAASDDPFADFRVPDHTWRSGIAQFQVAGTHDAYGPARSTGLVSATAMTFSRSHDSDALQHAFTVGLSGIIQAQSGRVAYDIPPLSSRQNVFSRSQSGQALVIGSLRAYPWAAPIGLELAGFAQGASAQYRARSDWTVWLTEPPPAMRAEQRVSQLQNDYSYRAGLELAAGIGRVRDATVVGDVHVLEERLLQTGALSRPLSPAAREKLAALYYIQAAVSAAHERPERFVWREVERILREDGSLSEGGLDPYSLIRARESYFGRVTRLRGWFVGPVASLRHDHDIMRTAVRWEERTFVADTLYGNFSESMASRNVNSLDRALLGGRAEYHRPLGWRWQVDAQAEVLIPVRSGEHGQDVRSSARLVWFIADRWQADARVAQRREWFRPRGADQADFDDWGVRYGAALAYYVEDHVTISAALDEAQTHEPFSGSTRRYGRLTLGLTYRFLGALDAPGLLDPMRPI